MRHRSMRALSLSSALAVSALAAACGGGGAGSPEMVLVSFNLPNIGGVPLNQPLIYTFSDNVDPLSVSPDTIQVNTAPPATFTFETIVVDGNLVAELPFIPNFDNYSDSGLQTGPQSTPRQYSVFLPIFPAVNTIRSVSGRPLVRADSFNFSTLPTVSFIEARRPLSHTPGPFSGPNLKGDADGCVNNPTNGLYAFPGLQFGTTADARLLCLAGEGPPHILNAPTNPSQSSNPFHDKRAVGTSSATAPGAIDLGAMRIRFNEPLDPISVTPYIPTTQLSLNVQLWRVGDGDAIPFIDPITGGPRQVQTTAPRVVQDLTKTEVILVPTGPQPQGTYLINIQGVRDLAGNLLVTADTPNPIPGGYGPIETAIVGKIAPGYRIYFRTLELPSTPNSITESFGNNVDEERNNLFTFSTAGNPNLAQVIAGSPGAGGGAGFVTAQAQPGQATTANWNGAFRFLDEPLAAGRPNIEANTVTNNVRNAGGGVLRAVFAPYLGNGDDLSFNVPAGGAQLSSDGGDFNGDGVFEFTDFTLGAGATLTLVGSRPILILVRGACVINGTINNNGVRGSPGIDTDGTAKYLNAATIESGGLGGVGGAGGGSGGRGGPALVLPNNGDSRTGSSGVNVLAEAVAIGGGGFGAFGDGAGMSQGGGGGGFGTAGSAGSGATNGVVSGSADFTRAAGTFVPKRCFQPSADLSGGAGGGGGGAEDDNGTSETGDAALQIVVGTGRISSGDDGGAGGGGGGGGLWIIADSISVNGAIHCDGGRGGNTYAPAGQTTVDPDGMAANGDEFVPSVLDENSASNLGGGGGGGGGSGGGILLQSRTTLTVGAAAAFTAIGGASGKSSLSAGGVGGSGRIALMTFAGSTDSAASVAPAITAGAVFTPAAGVSSASWKPTVDLTSQGVSIWLDFVTSVTKFSPPFWDDNFPALTGVGLVKGAGLDFDAVLEFQGADTLGSAPATSPTTGTGVTAWLAVPSSAGIAPTPFDLWQIHNKTFVRWRWRFFVNRADAVAGNNPDFDQTIHPMPQILSFTIPFTK